MTKQQRLIIYLAMILMPLSGIGVDIYLPSMPEIQQFFHAQPSLVKLTISMFLLGSALGQFSFGVISDSLGRKRTLLICCFVFAVTAYTATLAPNVSVLLVIRCIEGFMAGGVSSVTKAMVPDIFEKEKQGHAMTYIMTAWALGPIVAPFIGGYLQHGFGWHGPFVFLSLVSLVIGVLIAIKLPETHTNRQQFRFGTMMKNTGKVMQCWTVWQAGLCAGLLGAFIYGFNVASPFLFQVDLGYSPVEYGYIALVLGVVWMCSSLIARKVSHLGRPRLIGVGTWILVPYTLLMTFLAHQFGTTTLMIMIPYAVLLLMTGTPFINYMAQGVGGYPALPGTSSAVMSLLFIGTAFLMTVVVSFINLHILWPIFAFFFIMAVVVKVLTLIKGEKNGKRK